MWTSLRLRHTTKPELTAAVLFLCTAVSIMCMFLKIRNGPWLFSIISSGPTAAGVAAVASPLLFFCACILAFLRCRIGFPLGLLAGLSALPWFVWTESGLSPDSSWTYLNLVATYPEEKAFVVYVKLKILSMALIVFATFCSALRLLPARWVLGKYPWNERTWPAVAAGLIVLAVWFVHSASPYRTPIITRGVQPEFRILHIEKHGLHIHETEVSTTRNGVAWIWRNDRRLFQYRFDSQVSRISLADVSPSTIEHVRAFSQSPVLRSVRMAPAKALRSWNAEGWYVVLENSAPLAFTSENQTPPPQEVTDLFREIENLPAAERSSPIQDVCLGFCYDPVAALASH